MTDESSPKSTASPKGSSLDETKSPTYEIPLQTPPLDDFLPSSKTPADEPPPRGPWKRLVRATLTLGLLGLAAIALVWVLPTGHLPDPPGGALIRLISAGSSWAYLDDGSDPGPEWTQLGFDDTSWARGHALFGYGRKDETTVIRCRQGWPQGEPCPKGGDGDRILTHYFRHVFEVRNPQDFDRARISLLKDDGAVVYLNGEAIIRANMAPGVAGWTEPAAHEVENGRAWFDYFLDLRKLVDGPNVLAVEVHQASADGEDLAFDLQAVAFDNRARAVRRGPYLQMSTPNSVVIRWQTVDRVPGVVRWGAHDGPLDQITANDELGRDHRIELVGLAPATTYDYALGAEEHRLSTADRFNFTTPSDDPSSSLRIWAVGDQGTGDSLARKVKLAFLEHSADRPPDVWLSLGDNAYDDGTDAEFQRALFDTYPELLSRHNLWPATGNHDLKSVDGDRGPYFDIFELPTGGEAGGAASGSESYYSFDHGPAHFICLDTTRGDLRPGREMLTWLAADLEANTRPWMIVYFHHPPYTDGWHRSDDPKKGWRMTSVRETVLPILEQAGVDLVLAGHSHSYERSALLHGHYGTSDTLKPSMMLDSGDGNPTGDGPYVKPQGGRGTVYVVAGSSGKVAEGRLEHPAMVTSLMRLGSVVIDIEGDRLESVFVTDDGRVADRFVLVHR